MNKALFSKILPVTCSLVIGLLLTGCFDTKDVFTLNPDGSGKVVHECTFAEVNLSGESDGTEDSLKKAIGELISDTKGVEAWRDVSYKRTEDGKIFFKGTAYFTNLNKLDIPNQSMLEFDWKKSGEQVVLTLRTNKSEPKEGFKIEKQPIDLTKLTPEERAKKLKEERGKFEQVKPMMNAFVGQMKHNVTLHLPGVCEENFNFTKEASGALKLQFDGAKLLEAMGKLVGDDEWMARNINSLGGREKPAMDDQINAILFGSKAPVRATLRAGGKPLFDYSAEVAVAKTETAKLRSKLSVGSTAISIALPARGEPLKNVKVVGVRLVSKLEQQSTDFRPFSHDPGYTISLLVEFPGSILSITDKSRFETAIADDGTDLLQSSEWKRKIHFPKLSPDKSSALIEAELKLPDPNVKGLKELSGELVYQVSSATKEVDLGFTDLKPAAQGTEFGAQIKSIQEGWKKDGSQEMELKLNLAKSSLKSVSLVVDGVKTELNQRGYGGSGNSYTFTYESKTAFPAKGKIVADVYDQVQMFNTSFKLENISLLGTSMTTAK